MAKKKLKRRGIQAAIYFSFEYMGDKYRMPACDMGRFFGVGYTPLNTRKRDGVPDQEIANWAAEFGGHKPKQRILRAKFLRTRLV